MTKVTIDSEFNNYLQSQSVRPLFLHGDALEVLRNLPSESIDCCLTSPPYWGQRQYATEGIGLESKYTDYVADLAAVFKELQRVLKKSGSFWLNIGDSYQNK